MVNDNPPSITKDMLGGGEKIENMWFGDCPDDCYVLYHKSYIIYPNNVNFQRWEVFVIIMLIISCFLTPFEIAFPNDDFGMRDWVKYIIDKIFDLLFLTDIIITF